MAGTPFEQNVLFYCNKCVGAKRLFLTYEWGWWQRVKKRARATDDNLNSGIKNNSATTASKKKKRNTETLEAWLVDSLSKFFTSNPVCSDSMHIIYKCVCIYLCDCLTNAYNTPYEKMHFKTRK